MTRKHGESWRPARSPRPRAAGLVVGAGLGVAFWATPAAAQTWTGARTTPTLAELVAVDATGEAGWPYGAEDIEGDGAGTFRPSEQSLDVRTVYATTDASTFWLRVYVSNENAVGGSVTIYVFIDSDEDSTTGGSAAATDIDPALDTDPTSGGYEYVLALRGNGVLGDLNEWRPSGAFAVVNPPPAGAQAESGQDVDPIRLGAEQRGYVQASLPASAVGLTSACAARLFVRSVNQSASSTASDLDVGAAATCRPVDVNADGIPDSVVPPGCTTDSQCPAGGLCIGRVCVLAAPCTTDADCAPDEQCSASGLCVATPQGNCTTDADCGDLLCTGGQCSPCTARVGCGAGQSCAPDGRCVDGTSAGAGGATGSAGGGSGGAASLVDADEDVQGGACSCRAAGARHGQGPLAGLATAMGVAWVARRRRRMR